MSKADLIVARARGNAEQSRAALLGTLAEIRYRTDPRTLAADAADSLAEHARALPAGVSKTIRRHPLAAGGGALAVAGAIGVKLWLGRREARGNMARLLRYIRKLEQLARTA